MSLLIPLLHVQEYSETLNNKLITIKRKTTKKFVKTVAIHSALETFHQRAFNIVW